MAKLVFDSIADMQNLDLADWLDVEITEQSETAMVFASSAETITVNGTDFDYLFDIPVDGVVTSIVGAGDLDFTASGLNLDIADILEQVFSDPEGLIDLIFGDNDNITGSIGGDILFGFDGNDLLKGGKGSDELDGGAGVDRLMGGKAADRFVFDQASDSLKKHPDLILDLSVKDYIDLTLLGVTGEINFTYDLVKDVTTFSIDIDGDGESDFWLRASGDHQGFDNFST